MATHPQHVRVVHDQLGPFSKGMVVRANRFSPDDLERFKQAGAIEMSSDPDESEDVRNLSLAETVRFPSQFVLPNVPHTDASPEEIRGKMGVPPEAASVINADVAETLSARTQAASGAPERSPSGQSTISPEVADQLKAEDEAKKNR